MGSLKFSGVPEILPSLGPLATPLLPHPLWQPTLKLTRMEIVVLCVCGIKTGWENEAQNKTKQRLLLRINVGAWGPVG